MATSFYRVLLACIALVAAVGAAQGQEPAQAQHAGESQSLTWLKAGKYSALNQYYSQQQQDYEAGGITDQALYSSFRKLYEDSPDNARYFDAWVEAYPSSYAAVLARGVYFYRMAWAVRGDGYLTDTASSQIDAMQNWLARARPDLAASLKLTRKPFLSTLYLLNLAMLDGSDGERRHWYEQGMTIDPANGLLRYRYMFSLRPRWGGSYKQMEDYLHQCEEQQAPPALLARLKMLIHADLAEDAMRRADLQRTFDEWQQVINLAEVAGEEPSTEALIGYTRAAQDLGLAADGERGIAKLEGRNPDDAWSLARLGWIYVRAHQDAKGWPFLVRAAEQNDAWSQFVVGNTTYRGEPTLKLAPDQTTGLMWIRRSAQQCFPDAVQFLAAHGETPRTDCERQPNRWPAVIRSGTVALLTSLITGLIAATRKRKPTPQREGRMQYPVSILIVAVLTAGFFLVLAALSVIYDNGTGGPLVGGLFVAFSLLGVYLLLEYYRVQHALTADGLDFGRLLGPRGSLKWRDVTRIQYSPAPRWFRIETGAGQLVRISAMLTGLPEFARAVLEQVPSYAIDERTRDVLQACAQGELPPIAA
jgi:hypothetical protein